MGKVFYVELHGTVSSWEGCLEAGSLGLACLRGNCCQLFLRFNESLRGQCDVKRLVLILINM